MSLRSFTFLASVGASSADEFVPKCIAEKCSAPAIALGNDSYTAALGNCVATDFGPCASGAWACLGDSKCQKALECVPHVFSTCKDSIWSMMTEPDEREKIMCLLSCEKDGKINPICAAVHCTVEAVKCLADATCREAAMCVPKTLLGCSGEAFGCVFGTDKVCQDNLKCLGHGVSACAGPAANMLTDGKIADFISCAGSKCPHPSVPYHGASVANDNAVAVPGSEFTGSPQNPAEQLLCIAAKCGKKGLAILVDQDTKDLASCLTKRDLPELFPSLWNCLADEACRQAITCWSKPFESCDSDMWHALTDAAQRQRIENSVVCLKDCGRAHADDFVEATFCVLDNCGEEVLSCNKDDTCRSAVKCIPETLGVCAAPLLEAYLEQELLNNATKFIGRGLEYCGAAAVEMLRNQDIVDAVSCNVQCTIAPTAAMI